MATINDLREAINGVWRPPQGAGDTGAGQLGSVVTDGRQAQPGSVFWALGGIQPDATGSAAEAFRRGAAGVVASRPIDAPPDRWVLYVKDTTEALWQWAAWNRQHFSGVVIGVSGSVGKTTAQQMIHCVLKRRFKGTAAARKHDNRLGLPLSMLRLEAQYEYAIFELAPGERGEIAALAGLCRPTIGVITQVGDAHLGVFGSRQTSAETSGELLAALPADGFAVLGDEPWLHRIARQSPAKIVWVGRGAPCDVAASDVEAVNGELRFRVDGQKFRVPVWGRHHLTAALIAVAVGRLLGVHLAEAAEALEHLDSVPTRCEVLEARGATLINDMYNASPMAMRAALELLRDFDSSGRRIVVCGDMTELGEEAVAFHRRLGTDVVTLCGADLLIACGQYADEVVGAARAAGMSSARAIACHTADEVLPYLGQTILPGDVVLVKGARVIAMDRLVDALHSFPRRRSA
jgi:UDP-N-acetylmuramoyl-tripeptide--D-alanyl-D-alanine ligase